MVGVQGDLGGWGLGEGTGLQGLHHRQEPPGHLTGWL